MAVGFDAGPAPAHLQREAADVGRAVRSLRVDPEPGRLAAALRRAVAPGAAQGRLATCQATSSTPEDPPTGNQWIANAYPHPADLLASHRALYDRLFEIPARAAGFGRWGIKAVRLDGEHAGYLQVLYPDARFIFLHRNPWDAWSSYRRRHDERQSAYWWFYEWPDEQVATATALRQDLGRDGRIVPGVGARRGCDRGGLRGRRDR